MKSMHYYKSKCPNFHHQVHTLEEFKQCIKNVALNKLWNIAIQEELVTASFTSSNYVLPTYEIFKNNVLHFTFRVPSWILPKDHELYLSYNSFFSNVTLPKLLNDSLVNICCIRASLYLIQEKKKFL